MRVEILYNGKNSTRISECDSDMKPVNRPNGVVQFRAIIRYIMETWHHLEDRRVTLGSNSTFIDINNKLTKTEFIKLHCVYKFVVHISHINRNDFIYTIALNC